MGFCAKQNLPLELKNTGELYRHTWNTKIKENQEGDTWYDPANGFSTKYIFPSRSLT